MKSLSESAVDLVLLPRYGDGVPLLRLSSCFSTVRMVIIALNSERGYYINLVVGTSLGTDEGTSRAPALYGRSGILYGKVSIGFKVTAVRPAFGLPLGCRGFQVFGWRVPLFSEPQRPPWPAQGRRPESLGWGTTSETQGK